MKTCLTTLIFCCLCATAFGQGAMITEISYDNNYDQNDPFGIDSIEYVEIYLPDPQPTDPASWKIVSYNATSTGATTAETGFTKDLSDAILTWDSGGATYYVIEFQDSTFFGFPIGGIRDGTDGIALVEVGSPNIVHQFWRYETCVPFTALDGAAAGAVSNPITTDFSQTCGNSGVFLVQMNSATCTCMSLQQNGFGDWYLDMSTSNLPNLENSQNVPINLLYFDAVARDNDAKLTWATGQEAGNDYFSILHSTDGRSFSEIGKVQGKGDFNGESQYQYMVENLSSGQHYFKLKQVDFDGRFAEFQVKTIHVEEDAITLYPSLVTNEISLTNVEEGTVYQLIDMQGQLVKEATYQNTIDASGLTSGSYLLKVENAVLRFVKN